MNGSDAPRTRIFVVVSQKDEVKTIKVLKAHPFATREDFYKGLIRTRKALMEQYPRPRYRLIEGTASTLSDLAWSYPELMTEDPACDLATSPCKS